MARKISIVIGHCTRHNEPSGWEFGSDGGPDALASNAKASIPTALGELILGVGLINALGWFHWGRTVLWALEVATAASRVTGMEYQSECCEAVAGDLYKSPVLNPQAGCLRLPAIRALTALRFHTHTGSHPHTGSNYKQHKPENLWSSHRIARSQMGFIHFIKLTAFELVDTVRTLLLWNGMAPFVDDDPFSFLVKKDLFKRQSYSSSSSSSNWTRNVIISVIIIFLFLLIFTASFARRRSRRIALINAAAQEARIRQSQQTNGAYPPGQYNMDQSYQAAPNGYHQWSAPAPPYTPPPWQPPPSQHHTNDQPWSSPQAPIPQPPLAHQPPSPWQRPSGPPPTTWQPPSGPPPSGDAPSSQHTPSAWQPPSGPPPSSSVPTQQPPSVWRPLSSHAPPLDQPPSSPDPLISLSDPQAQTSPYLQAHKPPTSSDKKGFQQQEGQSPPSDPPSTPQPVVAGPPEPRVETPNSQPQSSTNPFRTQNTPEQAVRVGTAEYPPPYQA